MKYQPQALSALLLLATRVGAKEPYGDVYVTEKRRDGTVVNKVDKVRRVCLSACGLTESASVPRPYGHACTAP